MFLVTMKSLTPPQGGYLTRVPPQGGYLDLGTPPGGVPDPGTPPGGGGGYLTGFAFMCSLSKRVA